MIAPVLVRDGIVVREVRPAKPPPPQANEAPRPLWELPPAIGPQEWASARHHPDCIVDNLIYADVRLLIAPGGTGKTTLLLHEAICIALGLPLWGHEVLKPGPVVLVSSEDGREMLTARLRSMAVDMGLTAGEIDLLRDRVRISDVSGNGFKLTEVIGDIVTPSPMCDLLIAGMRDLRPVLVAFDPAVSFGVGENRVNDAEQGLIEAARRIRNALGCAVQYIHHSGKMNARNGTVDQYAGRGGSAFADGSRMVAVAASMTADDFLAETGQALADDETALRLALPKLSFCRQQPDLILRRAGYRFVAVPLSADGKTALRDATAEMLHRFLVSELEHGRRYSKAALEAERSDIARVDLRRALAWLETTGRVEQRRIDGVQRGAKNYLHPVLASPNASGEAKAETALGDLK